VGVGIGVGLLLVAAGAILAFAVEKDLRGLDVQVVGVILMIVGLVGIPGRRTVVEEEDVGPPPPGPPPPPP
jgi:hypothetical protein